MRNTPSHRSSHIIHRICRKMRAWGITESYLSTNLGVSRQYAWQVVHGRVSLSPGRALEIEHVVDDIIRQGSHVQTFGDRLRAARIAAGMTLKEVGLALGYTWVGVARWEKNIYLPKPRVLEELSGLYGSARIASRGTLPFTSDVLAGPRAHTPRRTAQ